MVNISSVLPQLLVLLRLGFQQEADALLKDPFRSRPVSSHVTNISYKNIMCAICNDDVENYTHWRIKLQPPEDTICMYWGVS